jgi:DNA-binding transcriptional regulator YdaS (Cro superfamily)
VIVIDQAETDRKALKRAAEILGGTELLSARLRVPEEQVERWIAGKETIPTGMFALAIGVMLENSGQQDVTKKK